MPRLDPLDELFGDRARQSSAYRRALIGKIYAALTEEDDLPTAKGLIRHYVNSAMGYEALAKLTGLHPKSLIRMLGERGNPTAANLFKILKVLKAHERAPVRRLRLSRLMPRAVNRADPQAA